MSRLGTPSPWASARIVIVPPEVNTPSSALAMKAETSFDTSLNATEMPIAAPAPMPPPTPAASDAAAATALIVDESIERIVTEPAVMPSVAGFAPSPSMPAVTNEAIRFSAWTPAPPTPTPAPPPPATAIDPAKTSESMA